MKFAFVENRYKTFFWEAVAKHLARDGHQIVWMVQNPAFAPTTGNAAVLPFPGSADLAAPGDSPALDFIRRSDRYLNYFGGSDRHYPHYRAAIDGWLSATSPDVVVGESTLFHELMAIDWCNRHGVPFLHPVMIGYPGGRYTVFAGDTKRPLVTDNPVPSYQDCISVAESIRRRERVPDYMLPPEKKDPMRTQPAPRSVRDRLKILCGYVAGERYNTPAPAVKWQLDRAVRKRLVQWNSLAKKKWSLSLDKRLALYPLQLQPESNLDVWGQAYRDQAGLVRALADTLPDGWHLLVKANPKAKYEVGEELIEVLGGHPRVSPVPLEQTMHQVMTAADLVCTVTGTVAVECVLSRKPLVQFGPSIVRDGPGCIQASGIGDVLRAIRLIEQGAFPLADDNARVELIRALYATTFPGLVSDPSSLPAVMSDSNSRSVADALYKIALGRVATTV